MPNGSEFSRREISFAQAEGVEPIATQMEPRIVTQQLRAKVWNIINAFMRDGIDRNTFNHVLKPQWQTVMLSWHIDVRHKFADEYNNEFDTQIAVAKTIISSGDYVGIFQFIEFVARNLNSKYFIELMNDQLEKCRSACRIVEESVMPFTSDEEAYAVNTAFQSLRHGRYAGAYVHLKQAGVFLTGGRWAASVRESIHAVEAVAKLIEPTANVLGPALVRLEKNGKLNPNLRRGINALYDYTSDEEGIRHALISGSEAHVGEDEAVFMFGACASFVTYLTRKSTLSTTAA